jgi:hypothetical protein
VSADTGLLLHCGRLSQLRELVSSTHGEETEQANEETIFAGPRRQPEIMIWHAG